MSTEVIRMQSRKIARLFSVLYEISKGMLFVSWVLLQLHAACVVQGFNVMPLEPVLDEGILFQSEFQIFTPSGKLHVCSRNLSSAHSSLWHIWKNSSDHLCRAAVSARSAISLEGRLFASLQTLLLTAAVSCDGCRILRCFLISFNWYRLPVDGWLHTKPALRFMFIPVNLSWCIQLWVGAAPVRAPAAFSRLSRLRTNGCI